MASWTSGYVSDLAYTHGFYRELTPNLLNYVALVSGVRPLMGPMNYCELGCGQGFSANLLAAANPDIRFYANDFNPTHIAGASALAKDAGLDNVRFSDSSFAELGADRGLPDRFDIIALHGIYSWISRENRRHIIEFIRDRLTPGGLVYLSYNTLPGWAPILPLRRMLLSASSADAPSAARIESGFAYIDALRQAEPRYFAANPAVVERFDGLKEMSRNYLAHEYFNRDWNAFYFADVAVELTDAKLSYLGSAQGYDLIDILNVTQNQKDLLRKETDVVLRETTRDFLVNQMFRRDVFARGTLPLARSEMINAWLDLPIVLTIPAVDIPKSLKVPLGEAELLPALYGPLVAGLAAGQTTLRQVLASAPDLASQSFGAVQQAVQVLIGGNLVQPCSQSAVHPQTVSRVNAFNQAVMRRAENNGDLMFLASPVTGGGVSVNRFAQLFLYYRLQGSRDPAQLVWQTLQRNEEQLSEHSKPVETEAQGIALLQDSYAHFEAKLLPLLQSVGIC